MHDLFMINTENVANIRPDRTVYDPLVENVKHYDPPVGPFTTGELFPWWNSTRRTSNMSYDLRGDVHGGYYYRI